MPSDRAQKLAARGICLLRRSVEEWEAIADTRFGGARFSLVFPHAVARAASRDSLVLISVQESTDFPLKLGLVRSVQATSTFDSRIVFDLVGSIGPKYLAELLGSITEKALRHPARKLGENLGQFVKIPTKLGEKLIALIAEQPEGDLVIRRIVAELDRPTRIENARALQQDAVSLAIKAFAARDGAVTLSLTGQDTSLSTVRLLEDAVIEHDSRWLPGWGMIDSFATGRAVFEQGTDRLEVITANKRPLERLFGVDLIYLNERRGALVMVQYKMMEPEVRSRRQISFAGLGEIEDVGEQEWLVSINTQFTAELDRMRIFDQDLSPNGAYRLNSGPFYFKLVKRNGAANGAGIVLSLDHLTQLMAEGLISGPRGGLRISYNTLDGHYLRSDPFVDLIRSGYIGTRGATTDNLRVLVEAGLESGHAIVAAIQSVMPNSDT